jgi:hypothetical protein
MIRALRLLTGDQADRLHTPHLAERRVNPRRSQHGAGRPTDAQMPEEAITIMTEIFTSEQLTGQPAGSAENRRPGL